MYGSVAELREYLDQIPQGTAQDVLLARVLDRATAITDLILGYTFGSATVGTRTVYGDGSTFLKLPAHVAGSVTLVSSLSSVTVPAYVQEDGYLRVVDSTGRRTYRRADSAYSWYTGYECDVTNGHYVQFGGGAAGGYWRAGVPYTVTATWGYGEVPADIVEATLEIAAAIHKERSAGFATVLGVEGAGAVNIRNALPLKAKTILDARAATPVTGAGVY